MMKRIYRMLHAEDDEFEGKRSALYKITSGNCEVPRGTKNRSKKYRKHRQELRHYRYSIGREVNGVKCCPSKWYLKRISCIFNLRQTNYREYKVKMSIRCKCWLSLWQRTITLRGSWNSGLEHPKRWQTTHPYTAV